MKLFTNEFILDKYKAYLKNEPTRKGTPKGEPIGFSRDKYKAMLYVMSGIKLRDVAKMLKISYQIVRRWNTEQEFKRAIIEHSQQFAQYLLDYLRTKNDKDLKFQADLLQLPMEEMIEKAFINRRDFSEFADCKFWSPALFMIVLDTLTNAVEKSNDYSFKTTISTVVGAMRHFCGVRPLPELREKEEEFRKLLERDMLRSVRDILLKPKSSLAEKKQAIITLTILEKSKE